MGILNNLKRWFMNLRGKAQEEFDVKSIVGNTMENHVNKCVRIYQGKPEWLDESEHIKTINFAQTICEETARLTTLGISIKLDGSERAEWLQKEVDKVYYKLREWVEYGCAYGTIALKPSGASIDMFTPDEFMVTDEENGKITGIVFINKKRVDKNYYTRLEYHRVVDGIYRVSNRTYKSDTAGDVGKPIDILKTPWKMLQEDVGIENLEKPLYAVLKMAGANNIEIGSPLGMPIISKAIEELKDLDIAYSRNSKEIYDSKRTVLMDSDKLLPYKGQNVQNAEQFENMRKRLDLPDYVRNVQGNGVSDFYQEINPTLNTDIRQSGINSYLSEIGFKCGFSNGYFVLDEKTGMITATQVESDDRRTIQTIKDVRDALESCISDLIYALDKMADLYNLSPVGAYEVVCDFGDITYNLEEDRLRWWGYVQAGKVPAYMYFIKFEGMTEDEAKAMQDELDAKALRDNQLFGDSE